MSTYTRTLSIEVEVDVEFDYYPGCPMRMYMQNGDPGYPAEDPEACVSKAFLGTGKNRIEVSDALSTETIDSLEERFLEEEPEVDLGY